MLRCMQCPTMEQRRRLLLNILHHLPVPKPVNAAFFDFCLQGMLSSAESASGQAVCMKLAYDICLEEPERQGTKAYLNSSEYYTVAVQCVATTHPQKNKVMKDIDTQRKSSLPRTLSGECGHHGRLAYVAPVKQYPSINCRYAPVQDAWLAAAGRLCLPEDDAQRTLQKDTMGRRADCRITLLLGNMSGHLRVVFDRIVYGMMGESPKGLPQALHKGKAVIVNTCSPHGHSISGLTRHAV